MIEPGRRANSVQVARVRAWIREDFGIDAATVDRIDTGADELALVWRATAVDGAAYAVKLSGGGSPAGLTVPAYLAREGVVGVPAPVPARDGGLWTEREGRRFSVVPWIAGTSAMEDGMTRAQWVAYGTLLARVHAAPVTEEIAAHLPRERHDHSRFSALTRTVDARLVPPATDPVAVALREAWHPCAPRIIAVVDAADRLAARLRTRPMTEVICHADPHLGNILRTDDGGLSLIDWDDVILSPRERDLMFVTGGVLAFVPVGMQDKEQFFQGYGNVDIDPHRMAYYLCVRGMEDLAGWAAQALDADRFTVAERERALVIVRAALGPTGLITLATTAVGQLD